MAQTSALLGYRFVSHGPELRIEHEFVEPVVVRLEPFALAIDPPSEDRLELLPGAESEEPVSFALCDVGPAAEHVRNAITARRRRRVPMLPLPIVRGHLLGMRSSALQTVNPSAHDVHQAVLRVRHDLPRLACDPRLYDYEYTIADIVQYPAAACALAYLEDGLFQSWCAHRDQPADPTPENLLAAMRQWPSLFSNTGQSYRSLNRTLMNVHPSVPADLLPHLRTFHQQTGVLAPLALTAALLHASDRRGARLTDTANAQRGMLERSTDEEISQAVARVGEFTERPLQAERRDDLAFTVRFLIDYPDVVGGRLDRLVFRAIRWHEELRERNRRQNELRARRNAPGDGAAPDPPIHLGMRPVRPEPTAQPPIPLPGTPGIEFLSSVERINAEARMMDNCIASYANAAVYGRCYLFHVRYKGEHACVEVDPQGKVRQAEGPCNSNNDAAEWGAKRLGRWGDRLAEFLRPVRHMSEPDPPPPAPADVDVTQQLPLWAEAGRRAGV